MKDFLKLNKYKLSFAFKFSSFLCLCVYSFFLILAKVYQNQIPSAKLFIGILVAAGILFPTLIIFFAYLHWENEKRYYAKFIKAKIGTDKNNFGYTEKLINQDSKWFFSKKILSKHINGFEIEIIFEYKDVVFYVYAVNKNIDKTKLEYFKDKIEKLGFENFIFRVFLLRTKRRKFETSIEEIESKLLKFVSLLEEYNYKPEN